MRASAFFALSFLAPVMMSMLALCAEKPRVFITDSKSWEIAGGGGGTSGGFGGATRGGARPQTAEIIKTFGERCPGVVTNNKQEKSDYIVLLDHEGGKGWIRKDNKVAVFNWDGDTILSRSTRSLGNSVQDACGAILKHWEQNASRRTQAATAPVQSTVAVDPKPTEAKARINVASEPSSADIEIDGAFVGNTPSSIELPPGEHQIIVKKSGYKPWERKLRISGGNINLAVELEK
jgi:hypothetical protein